MTSVSEPKIDDRPDEPYLGIRVQTPMKGMFKVADKLRKEPEAWFERQEVETAGPPFCVTT
jgi:hypothetical protein